MISGFPDDGTEGNYEILITASNEAGAIEVQFGLAIGPNPAAEEEIVTTTPAVEAEEVKREKVKVEKKPVKTTAIKLEKPIPNQVINIGAAYGPFHLNNFFIPQTGLRFHAELKNGNGLPAGLICTADGMLTGIPAKNTQGNYEVILTVEDAVGSINTNFFLTIKSALIAKGADYFDKLKAQVWQAVEQRLPVPELSDLLEKEITPLEINYLLERWGFIKIWDAFNLEPPSEFKLIQIEGVSEHYYVYDRGSCLVGFPKDLFSYERTLEDGMQTARAIAREAYKRQWTVELVGIDKLTRAAWVEIQHLGDTHGKRLEVINFSPTTDDIKIYNAQAIEKKMKSGFEGG